MDNIQNSPRRLNVLVFAMPALCEVMSVRLSGNFRFNLDLGQLLAIVASILSIIGSVATLLVLWK